MAHQIFINTANGADRIPVEPGQTLALGFEISGASFERVDADLVLSFDEGGSITLSGFFVADAEGNLPSLELADGTVVAGGDFLLGLDPDFDVSPAAGAASGGGLNAYNDGAGDLVNGLELSDSLGNFQWGAESGRQEEFVGNSVEYSADAPVGQTIVPPTPSSEAYHTRVIANSSTNGELRFSVFNENGEMITNPAQIGSSRFENSIYFNPPVIDPISGELIVTLTPAGLQALQDGTGFEDIMYVTVNGTEYPVHMLGNSGSGDYNFVDAEASSNLPGPLYAEHYSHESGNILDTKDVTLGGEKYNQADVLVSTGSGTANGMGNSNITLTDGVEGQINVSAETADGSAYAVRVEAGSESMEAGIDAGSKGDVNISAASGNATAMALLVQGATQNSTANVHGRDINFTAEASQRTAMGIWTTGKSEVNVEAEGDVHFKSTSTGGTVNYLAGAVYASGTSTVNITGQNVSAESNALAGGGADGSVMSSGFRTTAGSTVNITTAEDGTFKVTTYQETSPYSSPYSGVTWTGGRAAGFTSIGVSASGNADQGATAPAWP